MELRDYIEAGKMKIGTLEALANQLGMDRPNLSSAKAHRRGLPPYAVSQLAHLLEVDTEVITAASELVTERNEQKRAYWLPFVQNAQTFGKAASYALILAIVTNFVTPNSAEAAPVRDSARTRVCIMLSRKIFSCIAGILRFSVGFLQKGFVSRPGRFLVTGRELATP